MATIFSANNSNVQVDGESIEGLQSLAFRVITEREDIRGVGKDERIDVSFGLRTVQGELVVRSANEKLDGFLTDRSKFGLVANLAKQKGISVTDGTNYSFDECFIESKSFGMNANGTPVTTYGFSATRVHTQ